VPVEKDSSNYLLLIAQAELEPSRTFMIGKQSAVGHQSGVEGGLGAVFIPHPAIRGNWSMKKSITPMNG